MEFWNNTKYLFLDDIATLLGKSRSFCQKEVSSTRLVGEKKYILWKRKFVITKENFLDYVKNNPERVGNIQNLQENINDISKTINEIEESYKINISPEVQKIEVKQSTTSNTQEKQSNLNKNTPSDKDNILTDLLKQINNIKQGWSNDLYIEQLKITIEDLKKNNDDDKEEYKERINNLEWKVNTLQEELKDESKKVERSFFISDRYEKTLNKQNELLFNMMHLAKNLWDWWQLSLWDLKKLISTYWVNEKIIIDQANSDISIINETNDWFYEKLKNIDDNIIIEKSKSAELEEKNNNINTLNKQIKKKNTILYIIFTIILIFWIIIIWNYLF